MDKYLIHVSGQGDDNYCLVDKDIWEWVHFENDEKFPESLKNEFRKINEDNQDMEEELLDIEESMSSSDNDRALAVMCCFNYSWSVMALNEYCRKHDINIVEEYSGLIY